MYQVRPPAPELSRFIESYWFVGAEGPEASDLRVEVFVDGRADLVFNFGDPYVREVIGGERAEMVESNLDAQRLVPIRITQRGMLRTTGVRFQLGGVGPFARAPLKRFTGATPAPAAVFGEAANALEAVLRGTLDADVQKRLLDAFFCGIFTESKAFQGFEPVLQQAVAARGTADVEALGAAAGVSSRHVERLFARFLGIPPRTLGRVLRFQTALQALMRDPGCTLATVAATAGYFDQAHFVRDFREMTGGVPRGYRGYFPPQGPADFAPNVVVFVQDVDLEDAYSGSRTAQQSNGKGKHSMAKHWSGNGTKDDPWKLKTPPLTSEYTMYKDTAANPPLLVCQVGTTKLTYLASVLDDLPAMLAQQGDWMPLGAADEQKVAAEGSVEAWGRSPSNPVGGWYGQKKGYRGRLAMYVPPLLEALGKVELEHNPKNNRVRAK